jgi:PAS domain S-box-containing protein
MACNNSGVWNTEGASLDFVIPPAWYQTSWFRALYAGAFLGLLWGVYRLRLQQVRRDERKLQETVGTMPTMAWIAGPDGTNQFANRRWVEYTGQSQAGAEGEGWKAVIHPEDAERYVRRWLAAVASGDLFEEEARIRGADGEYRWFLSRAVALRDKGGEIRRWYGVSTDIEDRKHAEQLQADLAHTNRVSMLGELAASISHELKQPIAATITNARTSMRWLKREQPDLDEALQAAQRIEKDGARATEIIDRLRSLYKKAPTKRELVDVNQTIGEMGVMLRGEAHRFGVSIRTDLGADLPKITVDRVQLQQVLMNLMLNGIEAMNDTGGVLTVKSEPQDGQVVISVSDTGVGLPEGKADRIFDAFYTTKPQGSGMGLAISRSIIESHGGRLWATPNDGRGASFHFSLPTATEPAEASATGA